MSVIAPELDIHTKKRKRDEEQPLILRQPTPRPPTLFAPVPTSRVIDPPTPFSLHGDCDEDVMEDDDGTA